VFACVLRIKQGFALGQAFRTGTGLTLISALSIEIAENVVEWLATGGSMALYHGGAQLWAVPLSLFAGFLAPLPYKYFQLQRHAREGH